MRCGAKVKRACDPLARTIALDVLSPIVDSVEYRAWRADSAARESRPLFTGQVESRTPGSARGKRARTRRRMRTAAVRVRSLPILGITIELRHGANIAASARATSSRETAALAPHRRDVAEAIEGRRVPALLRVRLGREPHQLALYPMMTNGHNEVFSDGGHTPTRQARAGRPVGPRCRPRPVRVDELRRRGSRARKGRLPRAVLHFIR